MVEIARRLKKMQTVAANGLFTGSHIDQTAQIGKLLKTAANPLTTHFDQFRAAGQVLHQLSPELSDKLTASFFTPDFLPFTFTDIQYITSGGKQEVYKLDTPQQNYALKIDRKSLGMSQEKLEQRAKDMALDYMNICSLYSHVSGFIPAQNFLILNGPLLGTPALGAIQPFIEGDINGIFEDYHPEELIHLLKSNPRLKQQFSSVADTTLSIFANSQQCIDIVGKRNLSIVRGQEEDSLVFFDPQGITHWDIAAEQRKMLMEPRLEYLHYLRENI